MSEFEELMKMRDTTADPFPFLNANGRDRYSAPIRLDEEWTKFVSRDRVTGLSWDEVRGEF